MQDVNNSVPEVESDPLDDDSTIRRAARGNIAITSRINTLQTRTTEQIGAQLIESDVVRVQKCCESFELMIDRRCLHQNDSDIEPWTPMFTSETGHDNVQVPAFKFVIGIPECGSRQQWPIYHYPGSQDRLSLLPSGRLRHYISHHENDDVGGTLPVEGKEEHRRYYYEYELGTYCLDKVCSHMCNQKNI
uniref:Uncharacterized protein n=1 Tax=Timema cristinae TaxID=61476 RepID=A0A7R9D6R4_TIMCR|nr:unnamed protein product [Timema cristinae]